jgi:hypothetical protein
MPTGRHPSHVDIDVLLILLSSRHMCQLKCRGWRLAAHVRCCRLCTAERAVTMSVTGLAVNLLP